MRILSVFFFFHFDFFFFLPLQNRRSSPFQLARGHDSPFARRLVNLTNHIKILTTTPTRTTTTTTMENGTIGNATRASKGTSTHTNRHPCSRISRHPFYPAVAVEVAAEREHPLSCCRIRRSRLNCRPAFRLYSPSKAPLPIPAWLRP